MTAGASRDNAQDSPEGNLTSSFLRRALIDMGSAKFGRASFEPAASIGRMELFRFSCSPVSRVHLWQFSPWVPTGHASTAGIEHLLRSQERDGGWPAFIGDSESAWVTALVLCALNTTNDFAIARESAFHWLMMERGREGHWFWRWKFRIADRNVRFDPDKVRLALDSGLGKLGHPNGIQRHGAIKQFTVCNRLERRRNEFAGCRYAS
jgi:hypothetical protein